VHIALDDFGTGYSSLSFLRGFEFNKIKIDRSFVATMDTNEGSRKIVSSISKLAEQLGMVTTAEGVETEAQLDYIRSNGMTQAQGYLLGRPVSNDQLSFASYLPRERGMQAVKVDPTQAGRLSKSSAGGMHLGASEAYANQPEPSSFARM
jgi:predicted signal transduction protein with EAL and GGDEF domain